MLAGGSSLQTNALGLFQSFNGQWARILVRVDGKKYQQVLIIKMEGTSWKIQLWWEFPPASPTLSVRVSVIFSKDGQREEDARNTRASERVVEGLVGLTVEQLARVQECQLGI